LESNQAQNLTTKAVEWTLEPGRREVGGG